MRKEVVLPDRLGGERSVTLVPVAMHLHSNQPYRYNFIQSFIVKQKQKHKSYRLFICLPVCGPRRGVQVKTELKDETLLLPLGKRRRMTDR